MKDWTPRQLKDYWRWQLHGGPKPQFLRRRRKAAPRPLGERWGRWWKQHAPAWMGGKRKVEGGKRQRRRRARKAVKGAEFGPVVQAFLAGQSVRQATYYHRTSDPALMTAADWPAQLATAEAAIRASLLFTLEEIEKLREQLGAEEGK